MRRQLRSDRRDFLAASLAGVAILTTACMSEEKPKIPRVAWMGGNGEYKKRVHALFANYGLKPGENLTLEFTKLHGYEGGVDEEGVKKVVESRPDLIVVHGTPRYVMKFTREIPVVFFDLAFDPEAMGYVQTLRRPGGNVTGATIRELDTLIKQWQFAKEIKPGMRIGGRIVTDEIKQTIKRESEKDPGRGDPYRHSMKVLQQIGSELHIEIREIVIPEASSGAEIAAAIADAKVEALQRGFQATPGWMEFVGKTRIPTLHGHFNNVREGSVMIGYNIDWQECETHAVAMSVRILRGDNPALIPVYVIRNYTYAVNLRMARYAGLTIPPSVLLQTSEIVQ